MSKLKESLFLADAKRMIFGNKKNKILVVAVSVVTIGIIVAVLLVAGLKGKTEAVYKEAKAEFGLLSKGITESGSVDVGTKTQSFGLDISRFTGESSFSFGSTGGGNMSGMPGMDMPGGMGNMGSMGNIGEASGTASSTASARSLEIEEVFVEAGEEVSVNTPLLKLTEESVEGIRDLLSEDVTSAEIVYQQALTAQRQTTMEAENDYATNTLYGEYSQAEYDLSVKSLQETVDEKQEALLEEQELLTEAQTELSEKQILLEEQKQVLANAEYAEKGTDERENLYWWLVAWQTKEETQDLVTALEEEIEALKEDIVTYEENVNEAKTQLQLAEKSYELGEIEAGNIRSVRTYKAENAQEIYDVAMGQGSFDAQSALEDYENALAKLDEFDAKIVNQMVYADTDGLITDVYVTDGDFLVQDTEIVSMNDYDAVTITLSVEEDDMAFAQVGNPVNITIAAFSEDVFEGEVTEIGDAEIDSNTNKTLYSVTVTIQNTGNIFYQDMTAEVTFLTEEAAEVLFVPNRALTDENGKTYVLVKKEDGKTERREVITGLSDGVNTEIKEGLSEGEVVLWESKVKRS